MYEPDEMTPQREVYLKVLTMLVARRYLGVNSILAADLLEKIPESITLDELRIAGIESPRINELTPALVIWANDLVTFKELPDDLRIVVDQIQATDHTPIRTKAIEGPSYREAPFYKCLEWVRVYAPDGPLGKSRYKT